MAHSYEDYYRNLSGEALIRAYEANKDYVRSLLPEYFAAPLPSRRRRELSPERTRDRELD